MTMAKQMISKLKLAIIVNWKEEGNWSFLLLLKEAVSHVDILQPVSFSPGASRRLTHWSNYLSEFYLPLMAVLKKVRPDVIVSWQMRIGICYGILKRIVHARRPPLHVIQDFHIDLTKTSRSYRLQIALMKMAIPGIDFFFCTSTEEEEIYSRQFGIPPNRIAFLPLMAPQSHFREPDHPRKDYLFSYGNSDRDFDTLIRAAARMKIKTYILSQKYLPDTPLPANVSLLRNRTSETELIEWIAGSRIAVLPLKDYRIAAGQLSMLEVMALARPLIITENMATKEYAIHGQTALFFQAGDDQGLEELIRSLWNNPEAAEQIGRQARISALTLNDHRMTVFENLLDRCAIEIQKGEGR